MPDDWKCARITPIYKGKGPTNECNNYRPISVISHVSKLMEKAILVQMKEYLSSHDFISGSQSAFIKNHSTTTAIHKFISDVLDGINENEITAVCFIDLQKCFDTINHDLLLAILKMYGLIGMTYNWFSNYLNSRKQCVKNNHVLSSFLDIVMGVPQGSILGPILFLLFINDLPNAIVHSHCNLFADDTIVYSQANEMDVTESQLQNDLDNVMKWFHINKLHVNSSKSSCMTLTTKHNVRNLQITMNDTPIAVQSAFKYLGVNISNKLSWDKHISQVCKRLGYSIQILRKLKGVVPLDDLITVYKTLVQPHIDYCITIWGYAPACQVQRVQRLQNKIIRLVTGIYSWDISPRIILQDLDIANVTQRRNYFNGINVFKCLDGSFPNYMSDMLSYTSEYNEYNTRNVSNNELYVPRPRLDLYRQSFQYTGPMLYNSLPNTIKNVESLLCFKKELRSHVLS